MLNFNTYTIVWVFLCVDIIILTNMCIYGIIQHNVMKKVNIRHINGGNRI